MSQKYEKLKTLLQELFQLDQPDLDFGLYRVMHAKSAEVSAFLDKDLLPQVQAAFGQYKTADKAEIEKQLASVVAGVEAGGMEAGQSPRVRELRERLATDAVDIGALESEVYDHLFSFFRRYYSEGDFLAKRVYKPGVYAIPYEGEEVTLHWANKDQYYVKTSEYLRDYAFRLRLDNDKQPMRVHFRLADAAEGEHGNVKAAEGKDRVFILAAPGESGRDPSTSSGQSFIAEEDGEQGKELVIRFEYRPATLTDWPEEAREGKAKPPAQKDLSALAAKRLLAVTDASLAPWITELGKLHVTASGEKADYTRLEAHLRRYTARNTFDYFIHKDLGTFLRRELDFYIKNEVMHLDDVENETAPRVEQYLSKIRVIRKIAGKIITFLAQLEEFQKKLWVKKKFVVDTQWCITLDHIPEEFFPEIAACEAQREEWIKLFAIDGMSGDLVRPGYSNPLTATFLKEHLTLVVDTRHLDAELTARIVEALGDLNAQVDGFLINGDNYHALSLLQARFSERIQCVYIDPPFNTGDDFYFKDAYQVSSWLSFLEGRLEQGRKLLAPSGSQFLHLDHNANVQGRMLLNAVFGPENFANEIIWRIGWVSGYKTQVDAFVRNHDTIFFYSKDAKQHRFNKALSRIPYHSFDRDSIASELDSVMQKWGVDPKQVSNLKLSIKYPDGRVFKLGLKEKEAGYNIEDTWNCSEYEELNSNKIKRNAAEYTPHGSLITQKPEDLLKRIVELTTDKAEWVLDYFGGSGTTAAVAWKLGRKFVTAEAEAYFDDDLLWRFKKLLNGRAVGISRSLGGKSSGVVKYLRLESYEDALNNLEPRRTGTQQLLLGTAEAQGADGLKEQYILRYMLNVETRGSQSLLNVQAFTNPTAYKLKVKRPGSDESREVNVDLLETFNWLIGLTVKHIAAPQSFSAEFERDSEKRLRLSSKSGGRLKQDAAGPYWFRTVTGTTPDGRKALIIWRKLTGEPEQDNLVLDEWFTKQGYSAKDSEFDLIYVNGGNNLENLKTTDDLWKVRLIEEDFHRLMFETEGV